MNASRGSGRVPPVAGMPALALVPVGLAALVYHPILGNYFYADDFFNLFEIANKSALEFLLTPSGGHVLLARNALFYLSSRLSGTEPAYYFWTVLLTHLANVWLVDRLLRMLTGSARIACFGAALWGVCPLDAGALTWYSVYGHVVATFGILAALCLMGSPIARGEEPSWAARGAAFALALIAATSFGFGTGAATMLPVLLWLLFPAVARNSRRRLPPLSSLLVVVPIVYFGLVRLYCALYGKDLDLSAWVGNQVASQGTAIAVAFLRCAAFGASRLVFGLLVSPAAEPVWVAYPVAGLLLVAVALAAFGGSRLERRRIAAGALLALTCYGIVAVGRTQYLVAFNAEMLTGLARYHYLGLVGFVMLISAVVQRVSAKMRPNPRVADALLASWVVLNLAAYAVSPFPLDRQDQARRQTESTLSALRAEIASGVPGGQVRIRNRNFPALPAIAVPYTLFPGWAAVFVAFFPENTVDGRRVYFIQRNPAVIEALRDGRRTRDLFVPAEPSPAQPGNSKVQIPNSKPE